MSTFIESEELNDPEFRWGKKRGLGGKNKAVQFYDSFTYDGVDYSLYDCVYMYKQGESAPYIAKLIKTWETAEGIKKIKVQWFFRPSEISYYLKNTKVLENELFFASGDGIGLADLNPLEAIAGKCNVVCTSTDLRNPQPSAEELQMADYVFYRIFDVKSCTISDQMDDKVGGLEVNVVFNRRECVRILDSSKLDSGENDEACIEALKIAGNSSPQQLNNMKLDKNGNHMLEEEDTNVTQVPINQGSLVGKHSSGVDSISSVNREILGPSLEEKKTMGAKNIESNILEKKHESRDIKSCVSLVPTEKQMKKYARKSCDLHDAPTKRAKLDGSFLSDSNGAQGVSVPRNDAANLSTCAATSEGKLKSGLVADSVGCRKDVKLTENSNPLDDKLLKTGFSLSKDSSRSGHAEDAVGLQNNSKSNKNLIALQGQLSKAKASSCTQKEDLGTKHGKDSFVDEKNNKLAGNLSSRGENSSKTNVVPHVETHRPSKTNVSPKQIPKSTPNNEFEGFRQSKIPIKSSSISVKMEISAHESKEKSNLGHDKSQENKEGFKQGARPLQSSSTLTKRALEISVDEYKEKSNLGRDKSFGKEQKLASNSNSKDEGKKAKLDNSIKYLEVEKIKNLRENNLLGETKSSPQCATSSDNNGKSKLDEGLSNKNCHAKAKINLDETKNSPKFVSRDNIAKSKLGTGLSTVYHDKKDDKQLNDKLPNRFTSKVKDDGGKGGKIIEVTSKPRDKASWMKYSWDELMKTAHDQGKLVLLLNLDPEYTSGEVEDIIWHVFQENCEARMVPHTTVSNPYSGQAFVVFKSRDAANKIVRKLDDECLMLPNQRPLVACHGVLPKTFEKQTTFVGHLVIDRDRRQIQRTQRDWKEALSTSHYSQHNTIEFAMAMDWRLLQLQSDKWWGKLHEQQRKELRKVKENLKSK